MQKTSTAIIEFTRPQVEEILIEHACNKRGIPFEPTKDRVSVLLPDGGIIREVTITVYHDVASGSQVSRKTRLELSRVEAAHVVLNAAYGIPGCPTIYANSEVSLFLFGAKVTFTL